MSASSASTSGGLASVDLFRGIEPKELQHLERLAKRRTYEPGQVIIREHEGGIGFFLINSGRVRVVHQGKEGEERELATMGPGQTFGEMALFSDWARRSATVSAVEPTECLVLHRLDFIDHLRKHPDIAIRLLDTLSRRLNAAQQQL